MHLRTQHPIPRTIATKTMVGIQPSIGPSFFGKTLMRTHLDSVCMTYRAHLYHSLKLSLMLQLGAIRAFVHAVVPCLFVTSTTRLTESLSTQLASTGCR